MVKPNAGLTIITTAGKSLSGPCFEEYQFVEKLLDEHNTGVENDNYFALVCEFEPDIDDITDETKFIKANPLSATFPEGMNSLRNKLKQALQISSQMDDFKTKNLNVWVQGRKEGFLPSQKWDACKDESLKISDFKNMPCLVSFDLSAKIDLTSVGFMFYKDGLFYVFSHSFMPEDTLEQKMRTDRVNYRKWVEEGWMTMTPDAVVDYRFVKQYIVDTVKENNLQVLEVCADMWNATQFAQELEDEGFKVIDIVQGMKTLGPATKDFQEKVYAKKIRHNNNPVLNFAVSNAVVKKNHAEHFMLAKNLSTERIDPIASLINGNVRAIILEGGGRDLNNHILSDDWSF